MRPNVTSNKAHQWSPLRLRTRSHRPLEMSSNEGRCVEVAVSNVLQRHGGTNIPDEMRVALAPFSNRLACACLHQRTLAEAAN